MQLQILTGYLCLSALINGTAKLKQVQVLEQYPRHCLLNSVKVLSCIHHQDSSNIFNLLSLVTGPYSPINAFIITSTEAYVTGETISSHVSFQDSSVCSCQKLTLY